MYRINVLTSGKYNNVTHGYRYCLTKKSAKSLIDLFIESECALEVEKLIRIHKDIFCWSDADEGDKVIDYYYEKIDEEDS